MVELLLDPHKFKDFSESSVGVVVTLTPSSEGDQPLVVVGSCAAVLREEPVRELSAAGMASPDWVASVSSVLQHFPAGTSAGGVWLRVEPGSLESCINLLLKHTRLKDVFNTWPILLLSICGTGDALSVQPHLLDPAPSPPELEGVVPDDTTVTRYLTQHTVLLRVRATLPLYIMGNNIQRSLASLVRQIRSESTCFLLNPEQLLFGESSNNSLGTVLAEKCKAASKAPTPSSSQQHHMAHSQKRPLRVEVLEGTAQEGGESTELPRAPTLRCGELARGGEGCVLVRVPVDMLALVWWGWSLRSIALQLKERICSQLEAIREEIQWKVDTPHSVSLHHFTLTSQDCPVTVAYPDVPLAPLQSPEPAQSLTNQELRPQQAKWSKFFGVSSKSSQLRVLSRHPTGTELDWIASRNIRCQGPQMLDPHLTVKHTRVQGGTVGLVRGSYLYYHYMQEGFNDNGWGCAYRSLQTLWSWFRLQGFTEKQVPTHQQIQEALVKVGDKNQKFLGSKEWIGSFEVSTVLNQLLGIECKIHYTSNGGDMASAGRVLLAHFQTEGTPVMIGGGVLAHTILGVDFNTTSGEIQFLILDPHYTGREDLKTILDKGWCGWKPLSFWDSSAHYNMCMPLVPDQ